MARLFRPFAVFSFLVCLASSGLHGQQVIGVSTISVTASQVITYSATEMDYVTSYYYDAEADGFLWQNGTVIRSGSALGNPIADGYMSAPTAINNTYQIQTNHWLVAYYYVAGYGYNDPYGYSFLGGGSYGGTGNIYAPGTPAYVGSASYYIGSTYVATTSNAPVVSGLQVWSGDPVPGGNGYIILYGTDLTTYWGPTSISSGPGISVGVAYQSPNQINLTYMIDGGASPGTSNIDVSTLFGTSGQPFTVYPPVTTILSDGSLADAIAEWEPDGNGAYTVNMSGPAYTILEEYNLLQSATVINFPPCSIGEPRLCALWNGVGVLAKVTVTVMAIEGLRNVWSQRVPCPYGWPGDNGAVAPGPDWTWKGDGLPGSPEGNWVKNNPNGRPESLHPDLNHAAPKGPHWDYKDPDGKWWDVWKDGKMTPKK